MNHIVAARPEQIGVVRELFRRYESSLGFSLCFQGFEHELQGLPGRYAPPQGALLLGLVDGVASGCVAMRPLEEGVCEMKRLFVLPDARGTGLGRALVERVVQEARHAGYAAMRLDTIPSMRTAIRLYESLGFQQIAPYCANPIEGALYLELRL